jgi:hypothetical protein
MKMTNSDGKPRLPREMYAFQTEEGEQIFPLSYDPVGNTLTGFIDRYNVSGDDPAPNLTWDLATGKCNNGKDYDGIKQDMALQNSTTIPVLQPAAQVCSQV